MVPGRAHKLPYVVVISLHCNIYDVVCPILTWWSPGHRAQYTTLVRFLSTLTIDNATLEHINPTRGQHIYYTRYQTFHWHFPLPWLYALTFHAFGACLIKYASHKSDWMVDLAGNMGKEGYDLSLCMVCPVRPYAVTSGGVNWPTSHWVRVGNETITWHHSWLSSRAFSWQTVWHTAAMNFWKNS